MTEKTPTGVAFMDRLTEGGVPTRAFTLIYADPAMQSDIADRIAETHGNQITRIDLSKPGLKKKGLQAVFSTLWRVTRGPGITVVTNIQELSTLNDSQMWGHFIPKLHGSPGTVFFLTKREAKLMLSLRYYSNTIFVVGTDEDGNDTLDLLKHIPQMPEPTPTPG